MTPRTIILTIALVLSATSAALAQSAYTTGTAENRAEAGYSSPYSGAGIYAYAPNYDSGTTHRHSHRR
jgi:uncharacterized membrane protein